jgi:hypothetical protein
VPKLPREPAAAEANSEDNAAGENKELVPEERGSELPNEASEGNDEEVLEAPEANDAAVAGLTSNELSDIERKGEADDDDDSELEAAAAAAAAIVDEFKADDGLDDKDARRDTSEMSD